MRRGRRALVWTAAVAVLLLTSWLIWTERHPERERDLRTAVQDYLEAWVFDELESPAALFGFIERSPGDGRVLPRDTPPLTESALAERDRAPQVVLLHGLDEPGGIWTVLLPALADAGLVAWEFRYPNDQGIDRSAELLASGWAALPDSEPVYLVGHSMGGLVIRDFVSRLRYPDGSTATVAETAGPPIGGVILVGTPNQGSDWARFRAWLELRELLATVPRGEFSLLAGLREGTGAAKIDLRPGSRFLDALNDRRWPDAVPMRIIGGVIAEPTPAMRRSMGALGAELGSGELAEQLIDWWDELGDALGDGVVTVESLQVPGQPAPVVVAASHRGLLTDSRIDPIDDADDGETETPPAVPVVLEWLREWVRDDAASR